MSNGSKFRLGAGYKKVQPKLRVIANGNQDVNDVRSQMNGSVALAPSYKSSASADTIASMVQTAQQTAPEEETKVPAAGDLKEIPRETYVSVFIERTEKAVRSRASSPRMPRSERSRRATW